MSVEILEVARAAIDHGLCPIPIKVDGTKRPDGRWKHRMTTRPTVAEVDATFTDRDALGIVCGTVSGNLELLEFEGRALHLVTPYRQACADAGVGDTLDRVIAGYAEETPGGGLHLLWRCDQPVDGNTKLARRPATPDELTANPAEPVKVLIETRGEGGFVVVAPSNGATHSTGRPWVLKRGGLDQVAVVTLEDRNRLLEIACTFDEMPAPEPAPLRVSTNRTTSDGDSWMDATAAAFNQATGWPQLLEPAGWTFSHRTGEVDHWTRPGKDPKAGHSATVNAKGTDRLIVHSSSVAGFELSPTSYDRFGAWAILHHGGDRQAAALAARQDGHGPPLERHSVVDEDGLAALAGEAQTATQPTVIAPVLPPTFWDRRPLLRHIRQAAHSRNRSADVVLHGVLARVAASISHTIEIPPIVGAPGSLNYFVAITGPSGSGKSSGAHIATELVPTPAGIDLVDDMPLGSGEGLAELYMGVVEEEGPGGKPRQVRQQVRYNAFVYGDEGAALTAMMDRNGATLPEALRRAWTGAALGQTNATAERKRVIKHGQYRLGLLIGFQPELAGRLIADAVAGTPQRFLWASSIDPTVPDTPPDWPGHIDWQPPSKAQLDPLKTTGTGGYIRHRLTIDPDIAEGIRAADLARVRGQTHVDELDAHQPLHLLKTAGLLALLDRRLHIGHDDWQLAHTICEASNAVRTHVVNQVDDATRREEAGRIARHVTRESAAEAARLSIPGAVGRVAAVIARKLHQRNDDDQQPDDGYAKRDLNRLVAGRDKHLIDAALDHAATLGWINETDERYTAGDSRPA